MPFFVNGKALVVKGFLARFKALAQRNAEYLNEIGNLGIPMIGLEPAVTLTYRDEYPAILGTECIQFRVLLVQEWLATQVAQLKQLVGEGDGLKGESLTYLGHCTEKTLVPAAEKAWQQIFDAVGITVTFPAIGCCGMCGVFGHERVHLDESRGIYDLSWKPRIATSVGREPNSLERVVVAGHSCRSQVKRFEGREVLHPLLALAARLKLHR
jgi:Fe-S oxidoreductase